MQKISECLKLSELKLLYYHKPTRSKRIGHLEYEGDYLMFKYDGGTVSLPDLESIYLIDVLQKPA